MRKSQVFSVDFLVAVAVLTIALGLWVNSFSQIQKNAGGNITNASSFALAHYYFEKLSSGSTPAALNCVEEGNIVTCDLCRTQEKFFVQRLYSIGGAVKLLKVGVCS